MRSYRVQRHYGRWSLSLVVSLSVLLPTQSFSREPDTCVVQAAQASVSCSDTALGNNCGHCSHALLLSSQTRCMWPYQDPALIHLGIVAFFTQCELTDGCFDTTCWTPCATQIANAIFRKINVDDQTHLKSAAMVCSQYPGRNYSQI